MNIKEIRAQIEVDSNILQKAIIKTADDIIDDSNKYGIRNHMTDMLLKSFAIAIAAGVNCTLLEMASVDFTYRGGHR